MVGIFSRFSVGRNSHRRTQSAIDDKVVLAPNSHVIAATTTAGTTATHGIEVATEFKPVEHPVEPLDNDLPIQCPLPEPSILNVTFHEDIVPFVDLTVADGRIWKERVSASMRAKNDLQIVRDEAASESDGSAPKPPRLPQPNRSILPSLSAPEHNLLNLLEECNAMQPVPSTNG